MPIFSEWFTGSAGEYPGRAVFAPAAWKVSSLGEYWFDPMVDGLEAPTLVAGPNYDDAFTGSFPGVGSASSRGWLAYWSQSTNNLNALYLRTVRDSSGYSTYARDIAQQIRFTQFVNATHPAFAGADGWTMIQFEDEDEPAPLDVGLSSRGRPSIFTKYRARLHLAADSVDPFYAQVKVSARENGWSKPGLDGSTWRYGVIDAETGAPTGWDTIHSAVDDSATVELEITDIDEGGNHFPVLIALDVMGGSGDRTVDVSLIDLYASVVWPSFRYAKDASGAPSLRQRQVLSGVTGGPPLRQRQHGGYAGGPSLRQRQTGL